METIDANKDASPASLSGSAIADGFRTMSAAAAAAEAVRRVRANQPEAARAA
jgi:hypothetical protein